MKNRTLLLIALLLCFIAQWFVPVQMILAKEKVATKGTVHKLRVAPIDPYDPFRGRYLVLNFSDDEISIEDDSLFSSQWEDAYISLVKDSLGFSVPANASRVKPGGSDHLKCQVRLKYGSNELRISYPLNRFYLNEELAPSAETVYNQEVRNEREAWAEIFVYEGDMVLSDVLIEGKSIKIWAKEALNE